MKSLVHVPPPDVPTHETPVDDGPPRRRVLVVDDNGDAAELVSEGLAALGYDTRVAHDGPSALEIAREFLPDLALLDIGLPEMDGYELATLLRQEPQLVALRLVAITGYSQDTDRERTAAAGFDAHLVKPASFKSIAAVAASLTRSPA